MLSVYITFLITIIRANKADEEIWAELEWAQSEERTFYRQDLYRHICPLTTNFYLRRFRNALLLGTEKKLIEKLKHK